METQTEKPKTITKHKIKIIKPYEKKQRFAMHFDEPTLTKQNHKAECDINQIMSKYQQYGAISHFNKHSPSYGDCSLIDYQEAMNISLNARQIFNDLPSSLRKKFKNDPGKYLDFVSDPANRDEMIELGLATSTRPPVQSGLEQPAAPPEAPPAATSPAEKPPERTIPT